MSNPDLIERLARCQRMMRAIDDCGHDDAIRIATAYLEEMEEGFPTCLGGDAAAEAGFWAERATYPELLAYFFPAASASARWTWARAAACSSPVAFSMACRIRCARKSPIASCFANPKGKPHD